MLYYRDRTFCQFSTCAKFATCERALTEEIKLRAGRWWAASGGKPEDVPIMLYVDKPTCYEGE